MKEEILRTQNITKIFGEQKALDNINIKINKGDIYALVGRNGAGKTTLMNIITSLSIAEEGSVYLFGQDSSNNENIKNRMGSMIENPAFFPNLTAEENLKYYCILKGIVDQSQIKKVLKRVGLETVGKKKFKQYSLVMKQRLGIAYSILNNPDFIILDEPINGLDPMGIAEIRKTLLELQEENVTILISSHILSELYMVANRFCFIERGQMIKEITKEELDNECSRCLAIKVNDVKQASVILENTLNTTNYKVLNDNEIRLYEYLDSAPLISKKLLENNIELYGIGETGISLEDYFRIMIGEGEINV
ncbi:MAG: ATP-binding cassette domain-containing protein [Coprobacillaceae bacterium]